MSAPRGPRGAGRLDYAFALAVGALFLALAGAGARWLEHLAGEERVSLGVIADPHLIDMTAVYGSFAREAAEGGGLLVHNHQTALPHPPAQARPWELLVGRLVAAGGGGPDALVDLDRVLTALLFALALTFLAGELVARRAVRWMLVAAAFTGGSFYWIYELTGPAAPLHGPLTQWLRAMGGLSGLGFAFPVLLAGVPHLMLELVFFCAALGCLLRSVRGERVSLGWALACGLALLGQCAARPYTVPVSLGCALVLLGWRALRAGAPGERRRALAAALLAALPVAPLLWHDYRIVRGDTVFSGLDVYHPAPGVFEQGLFFGVPVLVAPALLLPRVRRRRRELGLDVRGGWLALGAWALFESLLVHGERFPPPLRIGWEVEAMLPLPLLVLLLAGLAADAAPARWVRRLGPVLLALHAVPTAVFVLELAERSAEPDSALFLHRSEAELLGWLERERPPDALTADRPPVALLCHPDLAPLVPWRAGVRVYAGHPDHTPDGPALLAQVRSFLADGRGAAEFARRGVTHVLAGPRERALRTVSDTAFEASLDPCAERVAASGDAVLYSLGP